jgi:hypothetical protein
MTTAAKTSFVPDDECAGWTASHLRCETPERWGPGFAENKRLGLGLIRVRKSTQGTLLAELVKFCTKVETGGGENRARHRIAEIA